MRSVIKFTLIHDKTVIKQDGQGTFSNILGNAKVSNIFGVC